VAESKTPRIGGESVLSRFSELMFVDVVRRYLETLPADRTGWLTGLRDPSVGRALTALDRSPNRDWTVGSLAREVGLSRSVLAERFTQFVGPPAMQYLTNWRMQLAANHVLKRQGQHRDRRRSRWVRVGSRIQQSVQKRGRNAPRPVAAAPPSLIPRAAAVGYATGLWHRPRETLKGGTPVRL